MGNVLAESTLESAECALGCSDGDRTILSGGDLLHGKPGTFTVLRCRRCGLMRTSPRPRPESIGNYYPENYGPYATSRIEQPSVVSGGQGVGRSFIRWLVRKVFKFQTDIIPSLQPGNL